MCVAIGLEEANSSDANKNNAAIANEGSIEMFNEKTSFEGLDVPMLIHCDEGNAAISEKRHETLQNKCDKGSTSIMQDLEHSEYIFKIMVIA